MDAVTHIVTSDGFWSKFRRRFLQYAILAARQPKWGPMFLFSRVHAIRRLIQFLSKRSSAINYEKERSVLQDLEPEKVVGALRKDGLYLGIVLPEHLLQEILRFSEDATYLGDGESEFSFSLADKKKQENKYRKKFRFGNNFEAASLCPAIRKLEKDPKLWEIAALYFETEPVLVGSQIWWTFVTEAAVEGHMRGNYQFHYDLDDYSCLKFLFYLKAVDAHSGPHVCVKGSHRKKKLSHQWSLIRETSDQDIMEYYGYEKVVTICEKAGVGFVEDTFCFHKGVLPINSDRLILEIKFGLNDFGGIV